MRTRNSMIPVPLSKDIDVMDRERCTTRYLSRDIDRSSAKVGKIPFSSKLALSIKGESPKRLVLLAFGNFDEKQAALLIKKPREDKVCRFFVSRVERMARLQFQHLLTDPLTDIEFNLRPIATVKARSCVL